jgi:hypothetical protein
MDLIPRTLKAASRFEELILEKRMADCLRQSDAGLPLEMSENFRENCAAAQMQRHFPVNKLGQKRLDRPTLQISSVGGLGEYPRHGDAVADDLEAHCDLGHSKHDGEHLEGPPGPFQNSPREQHGHSIQEQNHNHDAGEGPVLPTCHLAPGWRTR